MPPYFDSRERTSCAESRVFLGKFIHGEPRDVDTYSRGPLAMERTYNSTHGPRSTPSGSLQRPPGLGKAWRPPLSTGFPRNAHNSGWQAAGLPGVVKCQVNSTALPDTALIRDRGCTALGDVHASRSRKGYREEHPGKDHLPYHSENAISTSLQATGQSCTAVPPQSSQGILSTRLTKTEDCSQPPESPQDAETNHCGSSPCLRKSQRRSLRGKVQRCQSQLLQSKSNRTGYEAEGNDEHRQSRSSHPPASDVRDLCPRPIGRHLKQRSVQSFENFWRHDRHAVHPPSAYTHRDYECSSHLCGGQCDASYVPYPLFPSTPFNSHPHYCRAVRRMLEYQQCPFHGLKRFGDVWQHGALEGSLTSQCTKRLFLPYGPPHPPGGVNYQEFPHWDDMSSPSWMPYCCPMPQFRMLSCCCPARTSEGMTEGNRCCALVSKFEEGARYYHSSGRPHSTYGKSIPFLSSTFISRQRRPARSSASDRQQRQQDVSRRVCEERTAEGDSAAAQGPEPAELPKDVFFSSGGSHTTCSTSAEWTGLREAVKKRFLLAASEGYKGGGCPFDELRDSRESSLMDSDAVAMSNQHKAANTKHICSNEVDDVPRMPAKVPLTRPLLIDRQPVARSAVSEMLLGMIQRVVQGSSSTDEDRALSASCRGRPIIIKPLHPSDSLATVTPESINVEQPLHSAVVQLLHPEEGQALDSGADQPLHPEVEQPLHPGVDHTMYPGVETPQFPSMTAANTPRLLADTHKGETTTPSGPSTIPLTLPTVAPDPKQEVVTSKRYQILRRTARQPQQPLRPSSSFQKITLTSSSTSQSKDSTSVASSRPLLVQDSIDSASLSVTDKQRKQQDAAPSDLQVERGIISAQQDAVLAPLTRDHARLLAQGDPVTVAVWTPPPLPTEAPSGSQQRRLSRRDGIGGGDRQGFMSAAEKGLVLRVMSFQMAKNPESQYGGLMSRAFQSKTWPAEPKSTGAHMQAPESQSGATVEGGGECSVKKFGKIGYSTVRQPRALIHVEESKLTSDDRHVNASCQPSCGEPLEQREDPVMPGASSADVAVDQERKRLGSLEAEAFEFRDTELPPSISMLVSCAQSHFTTYEDFRQFLLKPCASIHSAVEHSRILRAVELLYSLMVELCDIDWGLTVYPPMQYRALRHLGTYRDECLSRLFYWTTGIQLPNCFGTPFIFDANSNTVESQNEALQQIEHLADLLHHLNGSKQGAVEDALLPVAAGVCLVAFYARLLKGRKLLRRLLLVLPWCPAVFLSLLILVAEVTSIVFPGAVTPDGLEQEANVKTKDPLLEVVDVTLTSLKSTDSTPKTAAECEDETRVTSNGVTNAGKTSAVMTDKLAKTMTCRLCCTHGVGDVLEGTTLRPRGRVSHDALHAKLGALVHNISLQFMSFQRTLKD